MATNNAWNSTDPLLVNANGSGDTSFTAYSVLCGGTTSTGNLQNVSGVGTSNQVLTSQGASALPQWAAAPKSWCWLASTTASNQASLAFTSLISTTYLVYLIIFDSVTPITDNVAFNMTFSTDNGSTYLSSNYKSGVNSFPYNSTTVTNTNSTTTCPLVSSNNVSTTGPFYSGSLYLYGLDSTIMTPNYFGSYSSYTHGAATLEYGDFFGYNSTTSGVTALSFAMSSGNISSGTFTLYGLTN